MGLRFLNIDYQSIVLPYNDEATPVKLTGVKMLPIIEKDNVVQNESLVIIKSFDNKNALNWTTLEQGATELEKLINKLANPIHSLCMPYWIWTPEFDKESRDYFKTKKEMKRGPFKNLIKQKDFFIDEVNRVLSEELLFHLKPFYKSPTLGIQDIMIAAHLWGLYIVPEFQFEPSVHRYLQSIKMQTKFDYHEDFWN